MLRRTTTLAWRGCAWTRRHGAGSHAALAPLDTLRNDVINASRRTALRVSTRVEDLAADPRVSNFHNTGLILASNVATDDLRFARHFTSSDGKRPVAAPYWKYGLLHASLCNREEELTMLIARTITTLNDISK